MGRTMKAIRETVEARAAAERYALDFPCPTCSVRQGRRCKPSDPDVGSATHPARLDLGGVKARREAQRARHAGRGGIA